MSCLVYTAQYKYSGANRIDVTYKTGNPIFAPDKKLVWDYKNGKITSSEYIKNYHLKMRKSFLENTKEWMKIVDSSFCVFVCFCNSKNFCHRKVLANYFEKLGCVYKGELIL